MTAIMITVTVLYAIGLLAAGVLVYRYGRYTKWRTTDIGRAFMLMKILLMALFAYLLVARWLPFPVQVALVFFLVGGIDFALIRQAKVIVKLQGGWNRGRESDARELVPPKHAER